MLVAPGGTSLPPLMSATGWQHSLRGFLAGILKKMGVQVVSSKAANGNRC